MLLLLSTSPSKKTGALEHLGADSFLAAMGTFDGIIDSLCYSSNYATAWSSKIQWETYYGWCTLRATRVTCLFVDYRKEDDVWKWYRRNEGDIRNN
ncbi:hypothetical protein ES319_A11G218800v1 [Gossypium barbadense]|uniref:Uncharacterized protein n=1 Tax=Gossypium barbadense TaxID=3634 RepID=A0A5J5TQX5_GOSBA|nr:hypothetical protein ES319_A11G218800v1 [Gossypium barbadense]